MVSPMPGFYSRVFTRDNHRNIGLRVAMGEMLLNMIECG
ncbi:hypothetical protein GGU45_002271 [Niabella hirudinis]